MTDHRCLAEQQEDEAIRENRAKRIADMERFAPLGDSDPAWEALREATKGLNETETEEQNEGENDG